MTAQRLREAVRALILDESDRVLLVRFDLPPRTLWAAPGGGIEPGEDPERALHREIGEEVGLRDADLGPLVWVRTHLFEMASGHAGQTERFYLVRTQRFDPRPLVGRAELRAEGVTEMRWWTLRELERSDAVFAPRHLPSLLRSLIADGPPPVPIDVGV